jgi:queuosine precursor transporter
MSLALTFLWILIVSAFSVLGAWYARQYNRPDALIAFYVTFGAFANIAASKTIAFDLGFTTFFAPAAVLIFSVTFLLTDVVNERFGKAETQRMVGIAVIAQIALVLFSYLVLHAEGAPFFQNQAAFEAVFGAVPRLVLASLIAFYVSENVDVHLFHWLRQWTGGKHLWVRNALSSLPAMFLDSVLFVTIAFYGVMPILPLIIGLTVIKWLVGIVDIPFMYLSRAVLGKSSA